MAEIVAFPSRQRAQPRAIISPSNEGYDVVVKPARAGKDLDAFFETYDSAEAYAFGLHKALGFAIVDAPLPERAA